MDEGNDDESNANFHISETTAVDNDITSNNKGDDKILGQKTILQ